MDKTPKELSREYYQSANHFTQTDSDDGKTLGKFYTDFEVAESMIQIMTDIYKPAPCARELRIIDPFCGDGRLIVKLLDALSRAQAIDGIPVKISAWDIDSTAVEQAAAAIASFCGGHGISYELDARTTDAFVECTSAYGSYDICVTNPPWGLLKPPKRRGKRSGEDEEYRNALSQYDSYMKAEFAVSQPSAKFGKWGTNLARCGAAAAFRMIRQHGVCGIVSPASLLNDQVSEKLRVWIFENYKVVNISYYPAALKLFGTADISSITMVAQGGKTDQSLRIRIYEDQTSYQLKEIGKDAFHYMKRSRYSIPFQTGLDAIPILMYLDRLPSALQYCSECGLRFTRELDETRFREKMEKSGKVEFAKGYMVDRYSFHGDGLYLNEEIVTAPPSSLCHKIVWRDVSRDSQRRRMKATLLPPGFICGNSLGVIYAEEKNLDNLKMLLAIMNSMIFEYQARSMLVSNHVAAGIVKRIHVPPPAIDPNVLDLVNRRLNGEDVEWMLEAAVANLYGISAESYEAIVNSFDYPEEWKTRLLQNYCEQARKGGESTNGIYNHYASTLSGLDMQVVRCVPPGGNWKDIPESVPSQRLAQIRESYREGKGSRSTYYGRLRPEMPAYTINTYFNRPGNGCNMHYDQDRTLSQREAARLQSFPDSFEFIGSIGSINNQIGNAVPPLLAYQIAKSIPLKGQFVDLFCGAGGLALGFVWAGWRLIVGNDIDRYAVETHRRNLGGDSVVGDINAPEIHDAIVSKALAARRERPDLPLFVLGGPPCQGFSTANTRRGAEDMRNWLFRSYAAIVKAIQPDGFVFENVRGILNLDKGKFFEIIRAELLEAVEAIQVNQVCAASFGVPQRRDRVIILGGSEELVHGFSMNEITYVPKNGQISMLPPVIGVEDAIGDLPPLRPGEDGSSFHYRFPPANAYQKFMRGEQTAEDYLRSYLEGKNRPLA